MNGFCGVFEAMKKLSGRRSLRCDKRQFRAKMTVSPGTVFELLLFEQKS